MEYIESNMRTMYKNRLILFILLLCNLGQAQDAHFSNSEMNASAANPAKVGMMSSDFKIMGSYRSQWWSIPDGFRTYTVGFENKQKAFSWGADILNNDAGEASLKQSNIRLKASYTKLLAQEGHSLRAGVAVGIIQQRFDPTAFQFDNQYEQGVGFNGSFSSQESFDKTNQILPDFTAGLIWTNKVGTIKNEIGVSLAHLNQAAASFYNNGDQIYPTRTFFHIKSTIPFNEKLSGIGNFQYAKQSSTQQTILGFGINYKLEEQKRLNIGIASRMKDAIILSAGIDIDNASFALNYDLHKSKLSGATNGNGAIELTAIFYFNKDKQNRTATPAPKVIQSPEDNSKLDSDNDGVPNGIDECPLIPGLWKYNGCNDKDEDGIIDSKDACPNLFGDKSNKGCPVDVMDSDLDGLIDSVDDCPFLKGSPEHKGCPDTDKDGVSDKIDRCPFLKGVASNNGCPKISSSPISQGEFRNDRLPKVHVEFDTDQSYIKPIYWPQLDQAVQTLMNRPEFNIYISGHTDAEGDAAYNHALGEKRSFEVMNYFIERGISMDRISIISYGETKPKHTNNNVYGKAKNRRAEIIFVQ